MEPNSKYSQPLKGRSASEKSSRKGVIVTIAALAVLGIAPFAYFYQDDLFPSQQTSNEMIVAKVKQPRLQPTQIKPTNEAQKISPEITNTVPSRGHKLDPAKGNFQPVEPTGKLIALKPSNGIPVRRQEAALAHLPDPLLVERSKVGILPKVSKNGDRPMDVYSRPPDTTGNFGVARVVIVIGGMGISQTTTNEAINKLPSGVTLAFAPYGNSLTRWMQKARKAGHELLLQMPMEPIDYPKNNPGKHTLLASADADQNINQMRWVMSRLTNYVGVTNYLGAKVLQQPASLSPIFGELARRGLLFFEDGSVRHSMGEGVAVKEQLPFAKASVQIDNVRSRKAIADKLKELSREAKRTGLAIGMGNAFPDTIDMVAKFALEAKRIGIEITPVTAIVKDPAS